MSVLLGVVLIVLLTVILLLLSVVESAIARPSILALRVLAERSQEPRRELLEEIVRDRNLFLLPFQYCSQLLLITISVLTTALCFLEGFAAPIVSSLLTLFVLVLVVRQVIPRIWSQRRAEKLLIRMLPSVRLVSRLLGWVSLPVTACIASLRGSSVDDSDQGREDDASVQAYLDVGEEEGIFESSETRLIQSALEFGSTSVREIMTPRNDIVAVEKEATLSRLREVILESKHSRIPVYVGGIDQIEGVVHARSLLARWDVGGKDGSIASMVKDLLVVPETKNVSQLLEELQERAEQMAIVANEYGTVSGLVTVEDLLEEIVGEIHDEDDLRSVDMIYDGSGSYIVRGSVDVGDLEEVLGVDYGDHDAATISGLIVDFLGKVPTPGETIVMGKTTIQVLNSDQRRIQRVKIGLLSASNESE